MKKHFEHVDEWLDAETTDERELPAKMWLEKFRAPAHRQDNAWLNAHALTCVHDGKVKRVVGCSRLGDVWLTSKLQDPAGYEERVGISTCSAWKMFLTDEQQAVDLDGPWRICSDHEIVGCFIPTIVDSCNRALFTAHAWKGVYERIVEDHNSRLKPFVSPYESEYESIPEPSDE